MKAEKDKTFTFLKRLHKELLPPTTSGELPWEKLKGIRSALRCFVEDNWSTEETTDKVQP